MAYQNSKLGDTIIRIADSAVIPKSIGNLDYAEALAWVAAGNTIQPYVPTAEEVVVDAEIAKTVADIAAAKADAKLAALAAMTPAQARAWINANVNNLADAKDALGTLAAAVVVLARRL